MQAQCKASVTFRFARSFLPLPCNLLIFMHYTCFSYSVRFTHFVYPPLGGPDEFSRISGLEPHDHLIYIKDSPIRIKVYDWQGKFHQTIQIPDKNIRGFYPLPKTNVILGHVPNLSGNAPIRFYFCQDTVISDSIPYYKSYTEPPFVMTLPMSSVLSTEIRLPHLRSCSAIRYLKFPTT